MIQYLHHVAALHAALIKLGVGIACAEMKNKNRIMEARGDSAEKVIRAKGTAEAMRLQKMEITSLYVEYLKVQTWDGKNPTTLVTDGSSTAVMVK